MMVLKNDMLETRNERNEPELIPVTECTFHGKMFLTLTNQLGSTYKTVVKGTSEQDMDALNMLNEQ